jgi:hypothetical protein
MSKKQYRPTQDTDLQVGDKVIAIRRGFAIGVGDTATVIEVVGNEYNPLADYYEMCVIVHLDSCDSDMETEASMWERQS